MSNKHQKFIFWYRFAKTVLREGPKKCSGSMCRSMLYKIWCTFGLILAYNLVWQPFEWKFANFVTKLNWVMETEIFENFRFWSLLFDSLNWLPFKLSKHRKKRQFSQVFLSVTNLRIYFWGQRFWTQKCFLYLLALRAFNFGICVQMFDFSNMAPYRLVKGRD